MFKRENADMDKSVSLSLFNNDDGFFPSLEKKKKKHVGFWDMQNYKERNTSCLPGARSYLSSTSCIVSGRGEPSVSGRNIAATPLRTGAPP